MTNKTQTAFTYFQQNGKTDKTYCNISLDNSFQNVLFIVFFAVTSSQCSTLESNGPQIPLPIHGHTTQGGVSIPYNHHAHPIHEASSSPQLSPDVNEHLHKIILPIPPNHQLPRSPHGPPSRHDKHPDAFIHQIPSHPTINQIPLNEAHHFYNHQSIQVHPDYWTPPKYDFGYNIYDPHTGDVKNQYEHRNGDHLRGTYSFIEANGLRRVVEYSSDPLTGFNAYVRHEPLNHVS